MQIELIGCTSAGKSNLAKMLLHAHAENGIRVASSYDFVLKWVHLDWIKFRALRVLSLNLVSILACLFTWHKNRALYRFATGVILRLPPDVHITEKLKIARITARNIGIDEIVRRNNSDHLVILADEGALQIAHYLFVHAKIPPNSIDLDAFVRLVPLPDMVIYVRQAESVLIARTLSRGHKRIPANSTAMVKSFIQNGQTVFEKLIRSSRLKNRLLILDGAEDFAAVETYLACTIQELARSITNAGPTTAIGQIL